MENTIRTEKLLNTDPDKLQLLGHQTRAIAMAMIRSAIDMMIHSDLKVCSESQSESARAFAKHMNPLVKDWDTDETNNVFAGAFHVFSQEPPNARMATIEDVLKMIYVSVHELSSGTEIAKEISLDGFGNMKGDDYEGPEL